MNTPIQPRIMAALQLPSTGATAFEEENSLAKEIFLGSTAIPLGTEPSGPVEPEDVVNVTTVSTVGAQGDDLSLQGETLAIPPMEAPADTQRILSEEHH